jgi:hypothetical protein
VSARKPYPRPPTVQELKLPKGLTRAEALKLAKRRARADFRGFGYDPKTGKASLL